MPKRPPGLDGSGPAFRLDSLPKLGDHDEFHPPPKSAADALPVSQITDNIFIGSVKDLSDPGKLRAMGITHILNVAKEVEMITAQELQEKQQKQENNSINTNSNKNNSINPDIALKTPPQSQSEQDKKQASTGSNNPLEEVAAELNDDADAIAKIVGSTGSSSNNNGNNNLDPRSQNNNNTNSNNKVSTVTSNSNNQQQQQQQQDLNALVAASGSPIDSASPVNDGGDETSSNLSDSQNLDGTLVRRTSVVLDDSFFRMKHIPLRDGVNKNTLDVIDVAVEYVSDAIEKEGAKIMVHCRRGISRSAAVVVAYLMEKKQMKYDSALELVKSRRAVVSLNLEFRMNLSSRCEERK